MWGRILIAAVVVLVVAVLCHLAIKAIQRLLALESVSLSQTSIVVNIVRIVVWGVAICFIADVCFDVNMTAVIAALGVGGIAISLGFQNTLSNLFGGVQVTLTHVIKPGDNIQVGTNQGVVEDINWSYTTIHNLNNETVIIPNSVMANNAVKHLPPVDHVTVSIVVMKDLSDLDSLADQIENAAAEAARAITTIVKDPVVSFNKVTNYGLYGSIALMIGDGSKASAGFRCDYACGRATCAGRPYSEVRGCNSAEGIVIIDFDKDMNRLSMLKVITVETAEN